MQNIEIGAFSSDFHLEDLKSLIAGHQAFIRKLEPKISVSVAHNFNINSYLNFFYNVIPQPKIIYLAYVNGQIAGYSSSYCAFNNAISVYRDHKYAILNELFVFEKFRKIGVATSLIKKSVAWAKDQKWVASVKCCKF